MIAVAFDTGGPAAVRDFIRPPQLLVPMLQFMGWNRALIEKAAAPSYPCLIDERHALGDSYGIVNVPTAVWIDEDGVIVRPPETPGATDAFRSMNHWIERGAASQHALAPDEVRRRMRGTDGNASLAAAHFRLGVWLAQHGERDAGQRALETAVRLEPESWRFRRQKIVLSDPALTGQLASTPEFWQAVQALGDRYYYPPTDMAGMPPPLPPR
ncbi:MAG: hypothetical protein E6J90_47300 [Deltaproteobacteria bacterium]|nr:MAG: hypothetical protein E6J90_47300 [Deltaproteobacteria bacterium]